MSRKGPLTRYFSWWRGPDMPVSGNTGIAPLTCSFYLAQPRSNSAWRVHDGPSAVNGAAESLACASHRAAIAEFGDDPAGRVNSMSTAVGDVEAKPLRDRILKQVPPRASNY